MDGHQMAERRYWSGPLPCPICRKKEASCLLPLQPNKSSADNVNARVGLSSYVTSKSPTNLEMETEGAYHSRDGKVAKPKLPGLLLPWERQEKFGGLTIMSCITRDSDASTSLCLWSLTLTAHLVRVAPLKMHQYSHYTAFCYSLVASFNLFFFLNLSPTSPFLHP